MLANEFEFTEDKSIHITTVEKVKDLIGSSFSTEEVKEVFDYIRGSYHYDVFKGELDEEVN